MSHATLTPPAANGLSVPRAGLVVAACFALGLAAGQGALDGVGRIAVTAFKALAESHYVMYEARENLAADGRQEFAVLHRDGGRDALHAFVRAQPGWSLREAFVPGWSVVSMPADVADGLDSLRASEHVRAVLRNRGMWICH